MSKIKTKEQKKIWTKKRKKKKTKINIVTIKDRLQHLIIHHYNYDLQVYVYTTGLYSLLCILLPAQLYHRMEVIFFISFSNKKKK